MYDKTRCQNKRSLNLLPNISKNNLLSQSQKKTFAGSTFCSSAVAGLRQLCNYDLFKPRGLWWWSSEDHPHHLLSTCWSGRINCANRFQNAAIWLPHEFWFWYVWYSMCSKHLKATLRFLSKCLRTDTAFLIKKYKSFLQWPSTANVQGYQTLARMREIKVRCWSTPWTSKFNAFKLWTW